MRALLLVVEVLSPSSGSTDRLRKRRLYQRRGVPEYWIVDVDARAVERWRAKEDVGTVFTDTLVWQPGRGVEPLPIDLGEYFRNVTGEG